MQKQIQRTRLARVEKHVQDVAQMMVVLQAQIMVLARRVYQADPEDDQSEFRAEVQDYLQQAMDEHLRGQQPSES